MGSPKENELENLSHFQKFDDDSELNTRWIFNWLALSNQMGCHEFVSPEGQLIALAVTAGMFSWKYRVIFKVMCMWKVIFTKIIENTVWNKICTI